MGMLSNKSLSLIVLFKLLKLDELKHYKWLLF